MVHRGLVGLNQAISKLFPKQLSMVHWAALSGKGAVRAKTKHDICSLHKQTVVSWRSYRDLIGGGRLPVTGFYCIKTPSYLLCLCSIMLI